MHLKRQRRKLNIVEIYPIKRLINIRIIIIEIYFGFCRGGLEKEKKTPR